MADRDDVAQKVSDLDARLREVEAIQELILRIMSTTKPLDGVLEQYGATQTQEAAFYKLLDDVASRAKGRDQDRPTFGYFATQLGVIFPSLRGDRVFVELVIDTLQVERPAYRDLHAYVSGQGWPLWPPVS
jgi:acetyl-CoA carboxylase alpha subunit